MMNTQKKLSEKQEGTVVKLYLSGLTGEKIGKIFGVSRMPIFDILKRNRVPTRNPSEARRIYYIDESYFEKVNSPEKAYILGVLYTDGNNYRKRNRIALGMNDLDVVEFFQSQIKTNKPIYSINKNGRLHYRMDIINKKMSEDLEKLGCGTNKTYELTFPSFSIVKEDFIPNFLQGAFDGDGCICKAKNHYSWSFIGTESMTTAFKDFIKFKIGEDVSIRQHNKSKHCYIITACSSKKISRIMSFLYERNEFKMKRKFDFFNANF